MYMTRRPSGETAGQAPSWLKRPSAVRLTGFEAVPWAALLAPKGTPSAVIQQLNEVVNQVLKSPAVIEEFARTGSYAMGGSVVDARRYLVEENARWGKAVKASCAQVD